MKGCITEGGFPPIPFLEVDMIYCRVFPGTSSGGESGLFFSGISERAVVGFRDSGKPVSELILHFG
ncbi:MAG: hypothetical protein WED07_14860 [Candidatus Freyarchaeum deiterrae]